MPDLTAPPTHDERELRAAQDRQRARDLTELALTCNPGALNGGEALLSLSPTCELYLRAAETYERIADDEDPR